MRWDDVREYQRHGEHGGGAALPVFECREPAGLVEYVLLALILVDDDADFGWGS